MEELEDIGVGELGAKWGKGRWKDRSVGTEGQKPCRTETGDRSVCACKRAMWRDSLCRAKALATALRLRRLEGEPGSCAEWLGGAVRQRVLERQGPSSFPRYPQDTKAG